MLLFYSIRQSFQNFFVLLFVPTTFPMRTALSKSRYYKERNVQSKKRQVIRRWFVSIRHGRHVLSQCPKQKHFPPVLVPIFNISGGWMPLFRALAKNMAPMTNADESPTNRLTLFPIYLSLFIVSTLWHYANELLKLWSQPVSLELFHQFLKFFSQLPQGHLVEETLSPDGKFTRQQSLISAPDI